MEDFRTEASDGKKATLWKKAVTVAHPSFGRRKHFLWHVASLSRKRNRLEIVLGNVTEVSDCCSSAWTYHARLLCKETGTSWRVSTSLLCSHRTYQTTVGVETLRSDNQDERNRERIDVGEETHKNKSRKRSNLSFCGGPPARSVTTVTASPPRSGRALRDESLQGAPLISAVHFRATILPLCTPHLCT